MAAAVSADQECEAGRGEDGAGPPEQIFFPKLTKRLLGRESFMITNIQSSSHRCLVFWESVFFWNYFDLETKSVVLSVL